MDCIYVPTVALPFGEVFHDSVKMGNQLIQCVSMKPCVFFSYLTVLIVGDSRHFTLFCNCHIMELEQNFIYF